MKIIQVNSIARARKIMWKSFMDDPDFKEVYVANMAMQLYDHLNITDHSIRNNVARKIIDYMYKEE